MSSYANAYARGALAAFPLNAIFVVAGNELTSVAPSCLS
jgi:hypothetical protein